MKSDPFGTAKRTGNTPVIQVLVQYCMISFRILDEIHELGEEGLKQFTSDQTINNPRHTVL